MACVSPTCVCVCTKAQVQGLSYNGIAYDDADILLSVVESPASRCYCVLTGTVAMLRTGGGGITDNLTIRVELHASPSGSPTSSIMYAEASLAVSGTPQWSGECFDGTSSLGSCTGDNRFSCGLPGNALNLVSWVEFGNSFNLVIDGDCCPVDCIDCYGASSITITISGVASAPCDLRYPYRPFPPYFCGDPAQINGVWVVPYKPGVGWYKEFNIGCGSPCAEESCGFYINLFCAPSNEGWLIDVAGLSGWYMSVVARRVIGDGVRLCCVDGAPYGGGDFNDGFTCEVSTWDGSFTVSP